MLTKIYPPVVKLRPGFCVAGAIVLILILGLILYNLWHAQTRLEESKTSVQALRVPSLHDRWYQNASEPKKEKPLPVKDNENVDQLENSFDDVAPEVPPNDFSENLSHEQEQLKRAMQAPIESQQITAQKTAPPSTQVEGSRNVNLANEPQALPSPSNDSPSNDSSSLKPAMAYSSSSYLLRQGTLISAVLITGIQSELPGSLLAQVRSPVYDSLTGQHLLIPAGTQIIGMYKEHLSYGQKRLQVLWNRLLFSDGHSLSLPDTPGSDVQGYVGLKDKVDAHTSTLWGGALLTSLVNGGGQWITPQKEGKTPHMSQMMAQNLGMSMAQTGQSVLEKNIERPPTIEIRPGYLFNIQLTQDIVFETME